MTDPDVLYEVPYRTRWTAVLFIVTLCGACTAVLTALAVSNDRGVLINGLIELGPAGATALLWVMAGFTAVATAVGVASGVQRVIWPMRIALTRDGVVAPVGPWSRTEFAIPYGDVFRVRLYRFNRNDFIELARPSGLYTIHGIRLPSAGAVQELADRIVERCPHLLWPANSPRANDPC